MEETSYKEPSGGKANRQKRIDFWVRVIKEQESSGLKPSEFCKANNIICRKLQDWKYRLKKAGLLLGSNQQATPPAIKLIPMKLEDCASMPSRIEDTLIELEIKLPDSSYSCKFQYRERLFESVIKVFRRIC